ncbi:MAG: FtsL-like putative cell division protein [Bacteroidia bacterium]|nr:FtsL-like putative cell division protein [Bacteroidia bacterium]
MSDDKLTIREEEQNLPEEQTIKLPKKRNTSFLPDFIGGDLFTKKTVTRQLPFIIYVVALSMIYITNTYIAEDVNSELMIQNRVLESKHVEYIYNKSEITKLTKQTQLVKQLKNKGIKESVEPLKKITIDVKQDNN